MNHYRTITSITNNSYVYRYLERYIRVCLALASTKKHNTNWDPAQYQTKPTLNCSYSYKFCFLFWYLTSGYSLNEWMIWFGLVSRRIAFLFLQFLNMFEICRCYKPEWKHNEPNLLSTQKFAPSLFPCFPFRAKTKTASCVVPQIVESTVYLIQTVCTKQSHEFNSPPTHTQLHCSSVPQQERTRHTLPDFTTIPRFTT